MSGYSVLHTLFHCVSMNTKSFPSFSCILLCYLHHNLLLECVWVLRKFTFWQHCAVFTLPESHCAIKFVYHIFFMNWWAFKQRTLFTEYGKICSEHCWWVTLKWCNIYLFTCYAKVVVCKPKTSTKNMRKNKIKTNAVAEGNIQKKIRCLWIEDEPHLQHYYNISNLQPHPVETTGSMPINYP